MGWLSDVFSTPDSPDYVGAANATAESNAAAASAQNWANRPTQNTPWGSSSWTASQQIDPTTGQPVTGWEQNVVLNPQQQAAFDAQNAVSSGRNQLAQGLIGRAGNELAQPMDFNNLPEVAGAPNVPNFYGQNLPAMGGLPDAQSNPFGGGQQQGVDRSRSLGAPPSKYSGTFGQDPMGGGGNMSAGGNPSFDMGVGNGMTFNQSGEFQGGGRMVTGVPEPWNNSNQAGGGGKQAAAMRRQQAQKGQQAQGQGDFSGSPTGEETIAGYNSMDAYKQGGQVQGRESAAYNPDFAQSQFDRQMSLQGPRMERSMAAMETKLRNQGLSPGSQAYDNAMGDLRDQQGEQTSRMSQDAMRLGASEQQNEFGRRMQSGSQLFNQQQDSGMYSAGQRGQQFGELGKIGDIQGGRAQAQFDREMGISDKQDRQRGQLTAEQLAFGGQGFDQQMSAGNYQNALRQQAIAEDQTRRGTSINEMNALQSGQQINMPNMPDFQGASSGGGTDYAGAALAGGNFALQAQQNSPFGRMAGGFGQGLGNAAAGSWGN